MANSIFVLWRRVPKHMHHSDFQHKTQEDENISLKTKYTHTYLHNSKSFCSTCTKCEFKAIILKVKKWEIFLLRITVQYKIRKFSPTAKFFRQIDLQYNSLVKKLIWRNFCKKSWGRGKSLQIYAYEKTRNSLPRKFFSVNTMLEISQFLPENKNLWVCEIFE